MQTVKKSMTCCGASCYMFNFLIIIIIQVEFKTHVTGLMVHWGQQTMFSCPQNVGWLLLSQWFSHGGSLMFCFSHRGSLMVVLSWWFSHGGSLMLFFLMMVLSWCFSHGVTLSCFLFIPSFYHGFSPGFIDSFHLWKVLFLNNRHNRFLKKKRFPVHNSLDMSCWRRGYNERLP